MALIRIDKLIAKLKGEVGNETQDPLNVVWDDRFDAQQQEYNCNELPMLLSTPPHMFVRYCNNNGNSIVSKLRPPHIQQILQRKKRNASILQIEQWNASIKSMSNDTKQEVTTIVKLLVDGYLHRNDLQIPQSIADLCYRFGDFSTRIKL